MKYMYSIGEHLLAYLDLLAQYFWIGNDQTIKSIYTDN